MLDVTPPTIAVPAVAVSAVVAARPLDNSTPSVCHPGLVFQCDFPDERACVLIRGVARLPVSEDGDLLNWLEIECNDRTECVLYKNINQRVTHVGDKDTPLMYRDASGRRVSYCGTHRSTITIESGLPPRDFDLALATERWVASLGHDRPKTPEDYLVERGLSSSRYPARQVASRLLIERGIHSIGALLRGLESPDLEVRSRCGVALRVIKTGVVVD